MYRILFHKSIFSEDLPKLQKSEQQKIIRAIAKKLAKEPEAFGKPLIGDLKGYFRLRVGFYRVVYSVDKGRIIVHVIKIGLRRDSKVYMEAVKRLGI